MIKIYEPNCHMLWKFRAPKLRKTHQDKHIHWIIVGFSVHGEEDDPEVHCVIDQTTTGKDDSAGKRRCDSN